MINFNIGATTAKNKTLPSGGIAVRGKVMPSAAKRFVDNGDGTITDKYLNLMWQKDPNERQSYEQILKMLPDYEPAGCRDWRLPTMHELSSIFDESYSNSNRFYDEFFKYNDIPHYLTSNIFEDTYVWVINFNFGYDGYYAEKTIPLGYRLVRNCTIGDESFQMPTSGQREIYNPEGAIIDVDFSRRSVSLRRHE